MFRLGTVPSLPSILDLQGLICVTPDIISLADGRTMKGQANLSLFEFPIPHLQSESTHLF